MGIINRSIVVFDFKNFTKTSKILNPVLTKPFGGYKMDNRNYRWSNKQIRNHVEVLDGVINPHMILKNATYLNAYLHQWLVANIWIYEDRIVYVGENFLKT